MRPPREIIDVVRRFRSGDMALDSRERRAVDRAARLFAFLMLCGWALFMVASVVSEIWAAPIVAIIGLGSLCAGLAGQGGLELLGLGDDDAP